MGREGIATIESLYQQALNQDSDINKHLPVLKKYAYGCDRVLEFGFRKGVSALGLLAAEPKYMLSIDWDKAPFEIDFFMLREYTNIAKTKLEYERHDTLDVQAVCSVRGKESFGLLFIDTFHTYEHLFLELIYYSDSINKYILIHDTEEFSCPGMFNAVEDFLIDNPQWRLKERIREKPGITVLERVISLGTDLSLKGFSFHYSTVFLANLQAEVAVQKDMYYDSIGANGSTNPDWKDYMMKMAYRFKNSSRWPDTNKKIGATEFAQKYSTS